MTITNPEFESTHRRGDAGKFAPKASERPIETLIGERPVQPCTGQRVLGAVGQPAEVQHGHSMAVGDD